MPLCVLSWRGQAWPCGCCWKLQALRSATRSVGGATALTVIVAAVLPQTPLPLPLVTTFVLTAPSPQPLHYPVGVIYPCTNLIPLQHRVCEVAEQRSPECSVPIAPRYAPLRYATPRVASPATLRSSKHIPPPECLKRPNQGSGVIETPRGRLLSLPRGE